MGLRSLLIVLILCCAGPAVQAEPVAQLKPTGYVNDFAHVLDSDTVAQLEDMCAQVDQKAHAQIAVVTINSLDGYDIESYAVELFKKWGIGAKATDRGVLILYAIQDRRARIEVGYGLEPILPDGKVGSFQREAVPLLRSGNYSGALSLVTGRVADVIANDAGIELKSSRPVAPVEPSGGEGGLSLGSLFIILIIVVLVLVTPLRSLLFWILFSQIFGGRGGYRGGGWGGGGFGGSGGFGGFGGGSSGGGGASSSW